MAHILVKANLQVDIYSPVIINPRIGHLLRSNVRLSHAHVTLAFVAYAQADCDQKQRDPRTHQDVGHRESLTLQIDFPMSLWAAAIPL